MFQRECVIFWTGQVYKDWERYSGNDDIWTNVLRALSEIPDDDDEEWDTSLVTKRLNLWALSILNGNPLTSSPTEVPSAWAPPERFAEAADRLAEAVEARDPDVRVFVEAEVWRSHDPKPRPIEEHDWDRLSNEMRRLARVGRKIADEGISLITLDLGYGDGWAGDPDGKMMADIWGEEADPKTTSSE